AREVEREHALVRRAVRRQRVERVADDEAVLRQRLDADEEVPPLELARLAPRVEVVEPDVVRIRARVIDEHEPAAVPGHERIRPPGRRERPLRVLLEQYRVVRYG